MTYFFNLNDVPSKTIAEGVDIKVIPGQKMTFVFFYISPGSVVPEHSHPHEQIGTLLKGALELTVGNEKRIVKNGDTWSIPPDVVHKGHCLEGPVEILEVFAPPREDFLKQNY